MDWDDFGWRVAGCLRENIDWWLKGVKNNEIENDDEG